MTFDVQAAADELLLTPEDLQSIFQLYFEDAHELLQAAQAAVRIADYPALAKAMHALKGSSVNLRFADTAQLAATLETAAKQGVPAAPTEVLAEIERLLVHNQQTVDNFYQALPSHL